MAYSPWHYKKPKAEIKLIQLKFGHIYKKNKKSGCFIKYKFNKTLRSVHFGVVVVELINCKCEGIVRNEIW